MSHQFNRLYDLSIPPFAYASESESESEKMFECPACADLLETKSENLIESSICSTDEQSLKFEENGKELDELFAFDNLELSKRLTDDQRKKLDEQIAKPVMRVIIELLRKWNVPFVIAGSMAGHVMGMVNGYADVDLFINAPNTDVIPGFIRAIREVDESAVDDDGESDSEKFKKNFDVDAEAFKADKYDAASGIRRGEPDPKRLQISSVIKIKPTNGAPIDLVFAPKADILTGLVYSLYVIRHFDMQQARVAIFKPNNGLHTPYHFMDLILPTWDHCMTSRVLKYQGRKKNVTPSKLKMLSLNTLIESRQVELRETK